MVLFGTKRKVCGYDIIREGEEVILYVYCDECTYSPSIEDNPVCMARTVEKIIEAGNVSKIIFSQKRDYEYDFNQTQMLVEIANIYKTIARQKNLFTIQALGTEPTCQKCIPTRYAEIQNEIFRLIKTDPIGAYVTIKRILRREKINKEKSIDEKCTKCIDRYIQVLNYLLKLLNNTKLIAQTKNEISGYTIGDRSIYRKIFNPTIKPDFMYTKLMANYPQNGEIIDNYTIADETEVTVFKFPDSVQYLYHIVPPEFKLSEEKYEILDIARKIMAEHKPKDEEFTDPDRMRHVFFNVGHDLIEEVTESKKLNLTAKEINNLTKILVRYTVGFGLIEVLLQDEKMQDISINSPMGKIPIFLVHADFGDCITNIIPTKGEAESWASKLRMLSGRPLDEADPILDTELELPGASTRVAVITRPLNPSGLAYSFRRHRDKPWTLPLFIKYKMINATAAGLLSFLVDGTRTMLIAGTRSAGKSSILSAMMVEIMRKYRMITIEDTLELPTNSLRNLGFNIQALKVASALSKDSSEVSATDGIRATLRLGDSALIVGEVRSKEALALYEAMRVGAAANVVAGTIHGDSPYGIYDRVVNDIGVPKTSFKATDIIVVANPVKSADGMHKFRRVTQITEVRKHWENDPLTEGGFVDLMKYNSKTDELEVSDEIITGNSDVLKTIASNIKEFAGNWDAIWNNIVLRGKLKQQLVDVSKQLNDPAILEAEFVILSNDIFHIISDKVKNETGNLDSDKIYNMWNEWLKKEIRKKQLTKKNA
jgi:archaeal flagellar protein FlaI